jgi:hypothetical protein
MRGPASQGPTSVAAHAPSAGARRPADARARTTPRWLRLRPASPRHPAQNARCLHLQAARSRGHVQHPPAAARSARTGLRQARAETMRSCDGTYGFLTVRRPSRHAREHAMSVDKESGRRKGKRLISHAAADQCQRSLTLRRAARSRVVIFTFASRHNLRLNLRRLLLLAFSAIFVSHTLSLPAAGLYIPNLCRYALGESPVCRWKIFRKNTASWYPTASLISCMLR